MTHRKPFCKIWYHKQILDPSLWCQEPRCWRGKRIPLDNLLKFNNLFFPRRPRNTRARWLTLSEKCKIMRYSTNTSGTKQRDEPSYLLNWMIKLLMLRYRLSIPNSYQISAKYKWHNITLSCLRSLLKIPLQIPNSTHSSKYLSAPASRDAYPEVIKIIPSVTKFLILYRR